MEEGIGEQRAVLWQAGAIGGARLHWPDRLAAGQVAEAVLARRLPKSSIGIARLASGVEAFASHLPRQITEGASIRIEITREAMAERGRFKRAQARWTDAPAGPVPSLAQALRDEGHDVREVPRFPAEVAWDELLAEAREGSVEFSGGTLLIALTPAMTLIDVDADYPESVYHNALPALAGALRRFDIGGNIGVDFPSVKDKGDRRAIDERLGKCLEGWPHERTAINGFGFVQIVARLQRPSLLQRLALYPAGAAARQLLRRAEGLNGSGMIELSAHPAVFTQMREEWLAELRRRSGRDVTTRPDPALAIEAPHAQLVPR